MSIYHLTTKPISRSRGRSATAAAAYRAGVRIEDERTGLAHDYSKRGGVAMAMAFDKDLNALDRRELWNNAELAEKRKDARTAREYIIAIPAELIPQLEDDQKNININKGALLAIKFSQKLAELYNVGVDVAIHAPHKEGDNRNWHAHIMTTTRELKHTHKGIELGDKATIELSNKKLLELDKPKTQDQIKTIRSLWADMTNSTLAEHDIDERIDERSYADRGIDRRPTIKLGWRASSMEREDIQTDRGDINREIVADNARMEALESEIRFKRARLIPKRYYEPNYQKQIIEETESELDSVAQLMLDKARHDALEQRDTERMQTLMIDTVDMSVFYGEALESIDLESAEAYKLAKKAQQDNKHIYKNNADIALDQFENDRTGQVATNKTEDVLSVESLVNIEKTRTMKLR